MKRIAAFFLVLIFCAALVSAQKLNSEIEKHWNPQSDDVYLQEVSVKITTDKPVVSIAEAGGTCNQFPNCSSIGAKYWVCPG